LNGFSAVVAVSVLVETEAPVALATAFPTAGRRIRNGRGQNFKVRPFDYQPHWKIAIF